MPQEVTKDAIGLLEYRRGDRHGQEQMDRHVTRDLADQGETLTTIEEGGLLGGKLARELLNDRHELGGWHLLDGQRKAHVLDHEMHDKTRKRRANEA